MGSTIKHEETGPLISPSLLQKIDKLREKNIGKHIPLPQLVAVGDQSSGKSSLLESLTGIPFPRNVELCTRYATQITQRRDEETRVDITIIPGVDATPAHKKEVEGYRSNARSMEDLRARFPEILAEVNAKMGIRSDATSKGGTVFSRDVLKVEICGPKEDYLTIIDVPGIFRNPTAGVTTKDDIQMVRDMVQDYIKDSRTIILAVLPSNIDIANQEILTLAEEYDKDGERTLGIMTKPDCVTETTAKNSVCSIVLGKKKQLNLGYYVVRSRGADEEDDEYERREEMFKQAPWNKLPQNRVGVKALKSRLGDLLGHITRRAFPTLRKDVNEMLRLTEEEEDGLGPSRYDQREQQKYLFGIAGQFEHIARASRNGQYADHPIFKENPTLRLITSIVQLNDEFNRDFETMGHLRYFQGTEPKYEIARPVEKAKSPFETVLDRYRRLIEQDDIGEVGNIVSLEYDINKPLTGIMDWIGEVYKDCRGLDLGTFNAGIISSVFKEQSSKWERMVRAYISVVILCIHHFITGVLNVVCVDRLVREELWAAISDEVLERYKAAVEHTKFLVSIERDETPFTLDPAFNERHQTARGSRIAGSLEQSSVGGAIFSADQIRTAVKEKSNVEHSKEEIHDILSSYYDGARRHFVDNVFKQVVRRHLLSGEKTSPLNVFSHGWVFDLTDDQLEAIAGESPTTKEQRMKLRNKIKDLKEAKDILKH
ncbi:P-loop containing nucleoside triphosphate hydrolase protein [Podospora didyma]|uniref:P-loop containing nucleoside triphosphate hydrolase protein n=1 Tax=Podospora didyma TaxID=330526 RepID=A0AAE0U816_9PEZI|nr:P-loop containing nucleoside triphosphate hydrolase protein [Podospora didyma]